MPPGSIAYHARMRDWVAAAARGAAVWALVGTSVAVLVCVPVLFAYAIWVVAYALLPAIAAGAIHGACLHWQRGGWARFAQLKRFGAFTGVLFGLLAFLPAFGQNGASYRWLYVGFYVAAAVAGGGAAGWMTAAVTRWQPGVRHSPARRAVSLLLVLAPLAAFDYWAFGERVRVRLPAIALSREAVVNLPAGDARSSRWSGCYQYEGRNLTGMSGGSAEFRHDGGRLVVVLGGDLELRGGIDADGRFWAGNERPTTDRAGALRYLFEGRFVDDTRFEHALRLTLLENGRVKNTIRTEGGGTPCASGR